MKHEENYQEWHNTTSKDKRERIALWNAGRKIFELFQQESWEHFENELNPWWTTMKKNSMKHSGNKRMIERKRSWKHKVKPCSDKMKLWNDITKKTWNSGKKDEQMKSRILMNLRNKELNLLDETRIRITLCSSFTN